MKLTFEEYAQKISCMAGKKRSRILGKNDLLQVIEEARRDKYGWVCGGHVANAYGYPARTMRIAAFRLRKLRGYGVQADWGNAKRSCSGVPFYGGERPMLKWMESVRRKPSLKALAAEGWDFVPEASVRRHLAERRLEARRKAESQWPSGEVPDIQVTIADSLAAGNCQRETARVAGWFDGRTEIPARELRAEILRREPTLASYAKRAVQEAASKEQRKEDR